jgi:hypothetical protein
MGVQTIRMEDGAYEWSWLARDGEHVCPGSYAISGKVVTFTDGGECAASWEAAFALTDDEIRWSAVRSGLEGDPFDQLLRELLHGKPGRRSTTSCQTSRRSQRVFTAPSTRSSS